MFYQLARPSSLRSRRVVLGERVRRVVRLLLICCSSSLNDAFGELFHCLRSGLTVKVLWITQ
jgi:hypothetical protein